MNGNNRTGSGAAWARGFVALFAVLAMGLGLLASPAEAAPFAYVANGTPNNCFGDRHGHAPPVRGGHDPGGE